MNMDEQKARDILGIVRGSENEPSYWSIGAWIDFGTSNEFVVIDGTMTADELEALAWWKRNMVK
jgi:hypothetical protein